MIGTSGDGKGMIMNKQRTGVVMENEGGREREGGMREREGEGGMRKREG